MKNERVGYNRGYGGEPVSAKPRYIPTPSEAIGFLMSVVGWLVLVYFGLIAVLLLVFPGQWRNGANPGAPIWQAWCFVAIYLLAGTVLVWAGRRLPRKGSRTP